MGIRSPRGYDSDHKVILGIIQAATVREHRNYLGGRKGFPLQVLIRDMSCGDMAFHQISRTRWEETAVAGPSQVSWISDETWRLVDD